MKTINNYINEYYRDGYTVIKSGMNKKECEKLIKQTLIPILHKNNIYLSNKYKYFNNVPGALISGKNGTHAISKDNKHFRFKPLFNSKILNEFLNKIHKRNYKNCNSNKTNNTNNSNNSYNTFNNWDYSYLSKEGLGWIHLRFPYYDYESNESDEGPKGPKGPKGPYAQDNSFHLDNTIETDNYSLINPEQSAVILPFISTVKQRGGGTGVIPGSHKIINDYILRYNYNTNKDIDTFIENKFENCKEFKEITGEQGDILIMHPHLVHSPTLADINSKIRITFNIGTITK